MCSVFTSPPSPPSNLSHPYFLPNPWSFSSIRSLKNHPIVGLEAAHYCSWQPNLFSQIWTGEKMKQETPPGATANNPDSVIFLFYNSTETFFWNGISNFELERPTLRMRFSLIILGNGVKPQLPDRYLVAKVHTSILHCPVRPSYNVQ